MRWLVPVVLLSATAALAHDADLVVVRLEPGARPGLLQETITLTGVTLAMLAPIDADGDQALSQGDLDARRKALRAGFWDEVPVAGGGKPCEWLEEKATLKEGFVELQAQLRCGAGELRQDFKILRVLPPNYRVTFTAQLSSADEPVSHFAQGTFTTITLSRGGRRSEGKGALLAVIAVLLAIGALAAWRLRRRETMV